MQSFIHLIRPDNFEDEVGRAGKPVLLLCMPRGDDFPGQLALLENIARCYRSSLAVGLLEEVFMEYFKNKLKISGTPTFLILAQGVEKNRMLGLADFQALEQFVLETLRQVDLHEELPWPGYPVV